MIFPKGTTGFFSVGDTIPVVDPKEFSKACYHLATGLKAKVISITTQLQTARNYYQADMEIRDQTILILCNTTHPFIAFANPSDAFVCGDFFDDAELASLIEVIEPFIVLPADVLNSEPETEQLSELSDTEISQIEYWRPSRLGDVVFNHWD